MAYEELSCCVGIAPKGAEFLCNLSHLAVRAVFYQMPIIRSMAARFLSCRPSYSPLAPPRWPWESSLPAQPHTVMMMAQATKTRMDGSIPMFGVNSRIDYKGVRWGTVMLWTLCSH